MSSVRRPSGRVPTVPDLLTLLTQNQTNTSPAAAPVSPVQAIMPQTFRPESGSPSQPVMPQTYSPATPAGPRRTSALPQIIAQESRPASPASSSVTFAPSVSAFAPESASERLRQLRQSGITIPERTTPADTRKTRTLQWDNVDSAKNTLSDWRDALADMTPQLEAGNAELEKRISELNALYADVKKLEGIYLNNQNSIARKLMEADYLSAAGRYNMLLEQFSREEAEFNALVGEYQSLESQFESGNKDYTALLYRQGGVFEQYKAQADALEAENKELYSQITLASQALAKARGYLNDANLQQELLKLQSAYEENERRINELRALADEAEENYYTGIPLQDDFDELSEPMKGTYDELYKLVNAFPPSSSYDHRDTVETGPFVSRLDDRYEKVSPYSFMTDEEIGVYNYLYSVDGRVAAGRFLAKLEDTLNYRMGEKDYNNLTDVGKALYWIPTGLDQFTSGIRQLASRDAVALSPVHYTGQMVQQEAYDKSAVHGFAYDLGVLMANMAPSILLSYVTAGLLSGAGVAASAASSAGALTGSASMALSASGNAYKTKINEGYTPEQARAYATLIGISEGALQHLLGGIGLLGGVNAEKLAIKIAGIDSALARIVLTAGVKMGAEGLEEGLQEILEPAFAALILDEQYEVEFSNVAQSFMLGALSAGFLEGPGIIRDNTGARAPVFDANQEGYKSEDGTDYFKGYNTLSKVESRFKELSAMHDGDPGVLEQITAQYNMRKAFYEGNRIVRQARAGKDPSAALSEVSPPPASDTVNPESAAQADGVQTQDTANVPAALDMGNTPVIYGNPAQGQTPAAVPGFARTAGAPAQNIQGGGFENVGAAEPGGLAPAGNGGLAPAGNGGLAPGGNGGLATVGSGAGLAPAGNGQGNNILYGDGRRLSGTGAAEQAGGVGGGAAKSTAAEQIRAARERQNRVNALPEIAAVSSRDIGMENGTDVPWLKLVPYEVFDAEMFATLRRINDEGYGVTYFTGTLEIAAPDGDFRANGAIVGTEIFIQADNKQWSIDQIGDHEVFHGEVSKNPRLIDDARQMIVERFSEDELKRVLDVYIEKLRGVIDIPENGSASETKEALSRILEELLADAYAGKNAFGAGATQFTDTVREAVHSLRNDGAPSRAAAAAVDNTTGPPNERYSAMYSNPAESFEDFYNFVMENKGNPKERDKSFYTQTLSDGSRLDIPFDRVMHIDSRHRLSTSDYALIFEGITDIKEAAASDKGHYGGTAVKAKVNTPGKTAGVVLDFTPSGRVILVTAFFDNSKKISNWIREGDSTILSDRSGFTPDNPAALPRGNRLSIDSIRGLLQNSNAKFSVDERPEPGYNDLMERGGAVFGSSDEAYTDGGRAIAFTYAVVPADALTVSNDEYGGVNSAYPAELQPRDRSRTASQMQIQDMSRRLNPALLAESPTAQNGAPIVRGDGVVIGGNARTQAIAAAYKAGLADNYERFIRERAGRYSISSDAFPEKPVLVRVVSGENNWAALAGELNTSTTAAYSATERAMTDASKMGDILDLIVPGDEGTINTESNRQFISQFLESVVPASERGGMTTADGLLSQAGLERAEYAIFASAYNNPELLARLSESLDNDAKNVTNALLDTASAAVALRTGIENGSLHDIGVIQNVLRAVEIYSTAKRQNKTVKEFISQLSLMDKYTVFDAFLAQFIEDNKRSAKQIRTMLNAIYDEVTDYGDPRQESFFESNTHTLENTLEGAIRRYENESGRKIGRPGTRGRTENGGVGEAGRELAGAEQFAGGRGYSTGGTEISGEPESADADAEPRGLSLPTPEEPAADGAAITEGGKSWAPEMRQKFFSNNTEPSTSERQGLPEGYDNIDAYIASLESRAAEAKAERMKNISKEDFTGSPALAKLGVKIENGVGVYRFVDSLISNDRAAKSVRKQVRKAERRLHATLAERKYAAGITDGFFSETDIPSSMDADKVLELADYYWTERAIASDMIDRQRGDIKSAQAEKMENLFANLDKMDVKQPRAIELSFRTMERNMYRAFGDTLGKAVNEAVFWPVDVNEAERYRFVNRMFDRVRTFKGKDGKMTKLTADERAAVQMVIEGRAVEELVAGMEMAAAIRNAAGNIKNGKSVSDAATEFSLKADERRLAEEYARWLKNEAVLKDGSVDAVKVDNAAKAYSGLYDQAYDAINDFLVAHGYEPIGYIKGYAPHFQPDENNSLLTSALKAMGLSEDVARLPASIAGRTKDFKPGKRWNPHFLQRTGADTEYDIEKGFQRYIEYLSDVLYHTDDIMRVRSMTDFFRRTYAPEEIKISLDTAFELQSARPDEKAEFLRDAGALKEGEELTHAQINLAMDNYISDLLRKIEKTTKFSDLVMALDNYANILAGKQSVTDRPGESMLGRESLNLGNRLLKLFAQAQVAGSLSSAVNQFSQHSFIIAENGARHTAHAIFDVLTKRINRADWSSQSDFLTGKLGVDKLTGTAGEHIIDALFTPTQIVDYFTSATAVRARYLKEIAAGKPHGEALRLADRYGRNVMGSRMKGSRPLVYESKSMGFRMLTMFQLEAANIWDHTATDMPREFRDIERQYGKGAAVKAAAGWITGLFLTAFIMNRLGDELAGVEPALFDLGGLLAEFVASGNGMTTNDWLRVVIDNVTEQLFGERIFDTDPAALDGDFDASAAAGEAGRRVLNDIPYLRNALGLLGYGNNKPAFPDLAGSASGIYDAVKEDGLLSPETGWAIAGLAGEILPGGRQINKTARGVETVLRGGRYKGYGDESRLQYPVDATWQEVMQAMMFGNNALSNTDRFYASGAQALTKEQTAIYESLVDGGMSRTDAYNAIQAYREIDGDNIQKYRAIDETGLTEREKFAVIGAFMGTAMETDAGNPTQYAKMLSVMDTGLSVGEYLDLKEAAQNDGAVVNYLEFYDAGLTATDAYARAIALDDIEPLPGSDSVSKMQKYRAIDDSGLTEREKLAAIGTIMGTAMETDAGNPTQYALMLDAVESGLSVGEYLDLKELDSVEDYLKYYEAGMSASSAADFAEAMANARESAGEDWDNSLTRYRAAVDIARSQKDQLIALSALMKEASFLKVSVASQYDITPSQYILMQEISYEISDDNYINQEEIVLVLNRMLGLTNEQKATLWQLTGNWAPKNNPYDTGIGAEVSKILQDSGGEK